MKTAVYYALGLALAGVANATPCTDQQITAIGLAYLQATSCDDVKAIVAPDCTDAGVPVSQNVLMMGGLCDQLGFDDFEDQVINGGGGGNSGSGGFGPPGGSGGGAVGPSFSGSGDAGSGSGSGSGDSSEDCVGDECCTLQQEIDFFKEASDIQSCDDLDNVEIPSCKFDGPTKDEAKLACIYQGVDTFKAELKKIQEELEERLNPGDVVSGSGSGSGSGSDSSEDCVGEDCCTLIQEINFVKEASNIQSCDDLDNVDIPTCKGAPPMDQVKLGCQAQGVDAFKAGWKKEQEKLAKKLEEQLKDNDPSAAFGANPLALALFAPLLAHLFLVL